MEIILLWSLWMVATYFIAKGNFHIGYLTRQIEISKHQLKMFDDPDFKMEDYNLVEKWTPKDNADQAWIEQDTWKVYTIKAKIKNLITKIKNTYGNIWTKEGNNRSNN